jgi:putative endonuclease
LTRAEAERRGRNGERWAALWLRLHGWRVIARRVRTARGEIDLVVRRGRQVAFIEVKWRGDAAALNQSIDEFRLRRVAAAVEAIAHRYSGPRDTLRIDVLLLAPWRWPRHIFNAWQP